MTLVLIGIAMGFWLIAFTLGLEALIGKPRRDTRIAFHCGWIFMAGVAAMLFVAWK